MRGRALALAAGLALLGGVLRLRSPSLLLEHNEPANYADAGEALIHGVPAPATGFRLNLANVTAALMFYHSGVSPEGWARLLYASQAALVFTAASLLRGGPWPPLAASALFLSLDGRLSGPQYPQTVFSILILVAANLMLLPRGAPSWTALALGITFLFRSTLAFFPPLLAGLFWAARGRAGGGPSRRALWLLCLAPYLFLIPTLKANWSARGEFVPFERGAASSNMVTGALGSTGTADGSVEALVDDPTVDLKSGGGVLRWSASQIARQPARYARAVGRRLAHVLALSPLLWILALLGAASWRRRPELGALGLLAGYLMLIHCLMSIEDDYFIPLWPLLCVLAAAPLLWLRAKAPEEQGVRLLWSRRLAQAFLGVALALSFYSGWKTFFLRKAACLDDACLEPALASALRAHPNDVWLLTQLARLDLRRGDLSAGIAGLSKILTLEPANTEARLHRAGARAALGDAAEILAWPATSFDACVLKALALLRGRRGREAGEVLRLAASVHSSALNLRLAGSEHEAALLERLKASWPRFADAAFDASYYWPRRDRLSLLGAAASLEGGVAARLRQVELAAQGGDTAEALSFLRQAERGPLGAGEALRLVEARLQLAWAAARLGKRPAGLEALAGLARLAPDAGQRHRAALAYQELREHRKAANLLRGLVAERPQRADLLSDLGVSEHLAGDDGAAVRHLSRAIELDEDLWPAYLSLAFIHASRGRLDEALALHDRALARPARDGAQRSVLVESREALLRRKAAARRNDRVSP